MNELQTIRENIRRIVGDGNAISAFAAEVISVTDTDCTVKYAGMELTGIQYFSQSTKAGNILLKPKVGSMVTIISDPGYRYCQLIQSDEISSFTFEENGLVIEFDSGTGKVAIKNNQVSLKDLFQSLANVVKNLKVSVLAPNSISGPVDPGTLTAVAQFETSFKQLLK